jgi:hypothetical protein
MRAGAKVFAVCVRDSSSDLLVLRCLNGAWSYGLEIVFVTLRVRDCWESRPPMNWRTPCLYSYLEQTCSFGLLRGRSFGEMFGQVETSCPVAYQTMLPHP